MSPSRAFLRAIRTFESWELLTWHDMWHGFHGSIPHHSAHTCKTSTHAAWPHFMTTTGRNALVIRLHWVSAMVCPLSSWRLTAVLSLRQEARSARMKTISFVARFIFSILKTKITLGSWVMSHWPRREFVPKLQPTPNGNHTKEESEIQHVVGGQSSLSLQNNLTSKARSG